MARVLVTGSGGCNGTMQLPALLEQGYQQWAKKTDVEETAAVIIQEAAR